MSFPFISIDLRYNLKFNNLKILKTHLVHIFKHIFLVFKFTSIFTHFFTQTYLKKKNLKFIV